VLKNYLSYEVNSTIVSSSKIRLEYYILEKINIELMNSYFKE